MGGLNGINNGILHLDIHGYNKNPIGWIKPMHVSKLFGTPMLTKVHIRTHILALGGHVQEHDTRISFESFFDSLHFMVWSLGPKLN